MLIQNSIYKELNIWLDFLFWLISFFNITIVYFSTVHVFMPVDTIFDYLIHTNAFKIKLNYTLYFKVYYWNEYLNHIITIDQLKLTQDKKEFILTLFDQKYIYKTLFEQEYTVSDIKYYINHVCLMSSILYDIKEEIFSFNELLFKPQDDINEINTVVETIIKAVLIISLIYSVYMKVTIYLLLLFGESFIVPLIKLELMKKNININLISDELLWEVGKIIIKREGNYEVLFLLIKAKLGLFS